jgi:ATP phosphoribosyltransferase regulatory subunit HisZ
MNSQIQPRYIDFAQRQLRKHMHMYGYVYLELPEIAEADLFLTRAGDKIIDQLLVFEKHGKRFAMRPEFTALAARYYTQQQLEQSMRWQFSGVIYHDIVDNVHEYQSYNVGAEHIGASEGYADIEMMAIATQGMSLLGVADWTLVVGHAGLQRILLSKMGIAPRIQEILLSQRHLYKNGNALPRAIHPMASVESSNTGQEQAQLPTGDADYALTLLLNSTKYGETMGGRNRNDITTRLLHKHQRQASMEDIQRAWAFLQAWSKIEVALPHARDTMLEKLKDYQLDSKDVLAVIDEWLMWLNSLEHYDVQDEQIIVQPDLTRNWNYYTGVVFGVRSHEGDYLASGGRYDDLIRIMSEDQREVPAVGFVWYLDRFLQLPQELPQSQERVLKLGGKDAIMLAHQLRQKIGYPIVIVSHDEQADAIIEDKACRLRREGTSHVYQNIDDLLVILKEYVS